MKVLDATKLTDLAEALVAKGFTVIAPVRDGQLTRLMPWKSGQAIDLSGFAANSIKDFIMPRGEVIARYKIEGNDFTAEEVTPPAPPTVILCCRPCDAAGLKLLDTVFNWDFQDIFYNARRAACTLVTMACATSDQSCFCTSVGGSPDNQSGSDAMLTSCDGGTRFTLASFTEKGQAVEDCVAGVSPAVAADGANAAGETPATPATPTPDPLAEIPRRFDHQAVTNWLAGNFESPLWQDLALGCLGCGGCAYACPSCHCFDIQDEATRTHSVRYRNWDSCGFSMFTLHTSGHNPRPTHTARWRQRVMHKYSYIPQRFNMLGCTGCGRCTRTCPNGLCIAEVCERIDALCKPQPSKK
jgi:sulfhydrogenase subunit beta (sulfur reductase)